MDGTRVEGAERASARRARTALIGAATEAVIANGVDALTVREVAQRAGYSVASLYNHIDGIPGLLAGARQAIEESLLATLSPAGSAPPGTPDALAQVFVDYAAYFFDRPHAFDLLFGSSAAARAAARDTAVAEHEAGLAAGWAFTFSGLVATGELAPDRVEQTALRLIYLVHGALLIAVSSSHVDPSAAREQVREAILWALAAEATHVRSMPK